MSSPRTRFAPSPSGHLHVGGARTALFCWAYARHRGGAFILRIEDTDQKRSSGAAAMAFLEDLAWLGIDWDEGPAFEGRGGGDVGPYRQSERLDLYDAAIERLLESGAAYRAFETPEELDASRAAAKAQNRAWTYDRAALALDAATIDQYLAEGRPHVVRFRVPEVASVVVPDVVRGEVEVATSEIDDFVIRKADGYPTYHLAVVVDDEAMGVTHVIRGAEHLINTPRHVLLQDALGYARPTYAHISLIFNPDGSKMSKRDKDKALRAEAKAKGVERVACLDDDVFAAWLKEKDRQLTLDDLERVAREIGAALPEINVDDFRRAGYLPDVLVNYLALLGWSPGDDVERFDRAFLLERFDFDRVIKGNAKFDRDKLLAFNLDAIQQLTPDDFVALSRDYCARERPEFLEKLDPAQFDLLMRANHGRSKTLADQLDSSRFFIEPDEAITYESTKPVRKALLKGEPCGYDHLAAIEPILAALEPWTVESVDAALADYAEAHADGKLGSVAQPLRVAVSGGPVSPAIHETLVILGRERVVARIRRCLAARPELAAASG